MFYEFSRISSLYLGDLFLINLGIISCSFFVVGVYMFCRTEIWSILGKMVISLALSMIFCNASDTSFQIGDCVGPA